MPTYDRNPLNPLRVRGNAIIPRRDHDGLNSGVIRGYDFRDLSSYPITFVPVAVLPCRLDNCSLLQCDVCVML